MCNFSEPWFGASYPDSTCENGWLYDLDGDGFDPEDIDHPCPQCNTREFLRRAFADAESIEGWGYSNGAVYVSGSGRTLWENGCAWARKFNPTEAGTIIAELGIPNFACEAKL